MAVPYLDSYVPQALEDWTNWDGTGHDLVLLGMYRIGHHSYLIGLDPKSGTPVGTVQVDESHLGGMAFFGDWLFTGDNPWPKPSSPTVQKYKVSDLRAAMQQAIKTHGQPYLRGDGPRQNIDATDFMTVDGDSLYTGNHGNSGSWGRVPGLMNRYVLNPDGRLKKVEGPWVVPDRAQGLVITPDDFLLSTDNNTGRGALYVIRRAAPAQTKAPVACIWMPAMPEDLTVHDGKVYSVFESGTARFAHDHPVNQIAHLHSGSLEALLGTVDPVALSAEKALGIAPTQPRNPSAPAAPLPTVPLPSIPLPTIPLLPGVPAPGAGPTVPSLPGLGQLPLVGGLTKSAHPGRARQPGGEPDDECGPGRRPARGNRPGRGRRHRPGAGPGVRTGGRTGSAVGRPGPDRPVCGSGARRPGRPGSELWKPSQRVSDALDFYNSELDRAGALLGSLVTGTDATTPAPAATPSPAPAVAPAAGTGRGGTAPAPDLTAQAPRPACPPRRPRHPPLLRRRRPRRPNGSPNSGSRGAWRRATASAADRPPIPRSGCPTPGTCTSTSSRPIRSSPAECSSRRSLSAESADWGRIVQSHCGASRRFALASLADLRGPEPPCPRKARTALASLADLRGPEPPIQRLFRRGLSADRATKCSIRPAPRRDATDQVVVDHPGRLHQRISRRRSDECEPALLELLGHRRRLGGARRDLGGRLRPGARLGRERPQQVRPGRRTRVRPRPGRCAAPLRSWPDCVRFRGPRAGGPRRRR